MRLSGHDVASAIGSLTKSKQAGLAAMMTQPVQGPSQGIVIFGSIPARYLLRHVVFEKLAVSG
ncbi:MAG: hypothetical protein JO344_08775 [Planctomycetaceae bacterium]|nr:hypothetical protein [Planctomycetaceae bacterium]